MYMSHYVNKSCPESSTNIYELILQLCVYFIKVNEFDDVQDMFCWWSFEGTSSFNMLYQWCKSSVYMKSDYTEQKWFCSLCIFKSCLQCLQTLVKILILLVSSFRNKLWLWLYTKNILLFRRYKILRIKYEYF